MRAPAEHDRVIAEISQAATEYGYRVLAVAESPLLGPKGNKEFLLHLKVGLSAVE